MDDREIARRGADMQARARDYPLISIPAYREWSERKLDEGGNDAWIAHLDAVSMWLLPEDVEKVGEDVFEELLKDLMGEKAGGG